MIFLKINCISQFIQIFTKNFYEIKTFNVIIFTCELKLTQFISRKIRCYMEVLLTYFDLYRDILTAFTALICLYFIFDWRTPKGLTLAILITWGLISTVLLYFFWCYTPTSEYNLARTVIIILPLFAFLPFTLEKNLKGLVCVFCTITITFVVGAFAGVFSAIPHCIILKTCILTGSQTILTVIMLHGFLKPLKQIINELNKGWELIVIITSLPCIIFIFISVFPEFIHIYRINMILLLIVCIANVVIYWTIFVLFSTLQKNYINEQENQIIQIKLASIENNIAESKEIEKKMRLLNHDLRHYVNLIISFIDENNLDKAKKTLNILASEAEKLSRYKEKAYCKDQTINVIINYFVNKGENLNITVKTKVDIGEHLPCDSMELAILLSNCLENAINACKQLPVDDNKQINIVLNKIEDQIFIEIKNTFCGEIIFDSQTNLPKTYRKGHGTGMKSIFNFIQKYNAQIKCYIFDHYFVLRIII